MKIAMIGHKRIPSREGGVEIVVEQLAKRMVEEGHSVVAYNRKGDHVSGNKYSKNDMKECYDGIVIRTVPTFQNGKLNAIVYSFIATIQAIFARYDVIHYHAEGPCVMLWMAKILGIRTIATIHGLDWKRAKWGGFATKTLKFGEKMAAKHADEVIVLSRNVQKYFKETYKRDVTYIPNGVEKPKIKSPQIIKEKYNLEKNEYILFLARIVPEKGLHYLVEAFKNIDTDKSLVIAGGSSHTDGYFNEIVKATDKDKRIIMTGFVEGRELEELYSNAYVYVLPSDVEGMPLSLLEAMSYGNCCLVSDISENREVIENYGLTFKKGNVEELQNKLKILLDDKNIVDEYKEKSAQYICEKYSWECITEDTLKLYNNNMRYQNEDIISE